jgi:hypothetical protein
LVNNPHPTLADGTLEVFGFRVDDPIPTIAIPLLDDDRVTLPLGEVYNHTYSMNLHFGLRLVDYEKLPERFDTYDEIDQERIQARIAAVAAHQS